jgi:hypothetical protein
VKYLDLSDSGAFSILYLARRAGDRNQHLATLCQMLNLDAPVRRPALRKRSPDQK